MAMSDWTLIETDLNKKIDTAKGQKFSFLYYTSFNDEDDQAIFGTIYQKFDDPKWVKDADGKDTDVLENGVFYPKVDESVRYCIQFAPKSLLQSNDWFVNNNQFDKNYAGFENVMFYNAGWQKTEWLVKYKKHKGSALDTNFCAWATTLESNDEVWSVVADYWDKTENAFYLDVTRQLQWADDETTDDYAELNPNGATNIPPDTEQVFFFSMGIFPTSSAADTWRVKADTWPLGGKVAGGNNTVLLIQDSAKATLAALTVTTAAVLASLY